MYRFDGRADRHVGRRDTIPDFSGTWNGRLPGGGSSFLQRLTITQAGLNVAVADYSETVLGEGLAVAPRLKGNGSIVNGQVDLNMIPSGPGLIIRGLLNTRRITLTLPNPDTLHVVTHSPFTAGGLQQDESVDLTRS